jgi:hypothetical protein
VSLTFSTAVQPGGMTWSDTVKIRDDVRMQILHNCSEPDIG